MAAQQRALVMLPTILLGKAFQDGALRSDITGALQGSVNLFWNLRRQ
jgi:peptide/nickel transport system substrate-binding protein